MLKPSHVFVVLFLFSGCRSVVMSPRDAIFVDQQFVVAKLGSSNPAAANVVFTRDQGGPTGRRWLIYIDGKIAVKLGRGEKYSIRLDPGDHIFGIEPDAPLKVLQIMNISQNLSQNKTYYFRAMFTGEEFRIQPSTGDTEIR